MSKLARVAIVVSGCGLLGNGGCPPPQPPPPGSHCGVALNNISNVKLGSGQSLLLQPGGPERTVDVAVSASGEQASDVLFCVGILAGDLQTNRATDHQLGGTIILGGPDRWAGGFSARCTSDRKLEVQVFDGTMNTNGLPNVKWASIGTAENNIYALPLPAGAFTPASNTFKLKCQ
jgi:hypothetical protein